MNSVPDHIPLHPSDWQVLVLSPLGLCPSLQLKFAVERYVVAPMLICPPSGGGRVLQSTTGQRKEEKNFKSEEKAHSYFGKLVLVLSTLPLVYTYESHPRFGGSTLLCTRRLLWIPPKCLLGSRCHQLVSPLSDLRIVLLVSNGSRYNNTIK